MTPEETRTVAKEAANEAVAATLTALGIDINNPHDTQADFNWLHNTRKQSEKFRFALLLALTISLLGFLGAVLWSGIVQAIRGE